MADIQSPAAEIRRGKYKEEERKEKPQGKNIMVCPIPQGDHNGLIPDSTVLDLLQIHKEKTVTRFTYLFSLWYCSVAKLFELLKKQTI